MNVIEMNDDKVICQWGNEGQIYQKEFRAKDLTSWVYAKVEWKLG